MSNIIRIQQIDLLLYNKNEITIVDMKQGITLQIPIKEIKKSSLLSLLNKYPSLKDKKIKHGRKNKNDRKTKRR